MKNLENLNVQEINATELANIDGGTAPSLLNINWVTDYIIRILNL